MPRRYGYGPYESSGRYALVVAFYPMALAMWLAGTICHPLCRKRRSSGARRVAGGTVTHTDTLRHLPILSAEQCATVGNDVHALRALWIRRQPGFFTLGRAAYLDCRNLQERHRYFDDARQLNDALIQNFQPLYTTLTTALQDALGAPCRLTDHYAIPGFHVWRGRGIPRHEFDAGSVHFDLQYLDIGLHEGGWPTTADLLSFTLPIRLPKAGGGINVWDIRYPEPAGWEIRPFKNVSRVRYSPGCLVLHSGHELHQIAPVARIEAQDERICLQGHGIRKDGIWFLYW